MNCQILLSRKNKEIFENLSSAEIFTQHAILVLRVKKQAYRNKMCLSVF